MSVERDNFKAWSKFNLIVSAAVDRRDDCQRSIDLAVVANKLAESAGLVEEQVVREQYLF